MSKREQHTYVILNNDAMTEKATTVHIFTNLRYHIYTEFPLKIQILTLSRFFSRIVLTYIELIIFQLLRLL